MEDCIAVGKCRSWAVRALWPLALAALPLLGSMAAAEQVEDLRGRTVDVSVPVDAISIDDGRFLMALALLHPDPGSVLAAWPRDIHRIGQTVYEALVAASPGLASVPQVASSAGSFNLEALLAAAPGAAVVSLASGPTDAQVRQLEAVGIPVVFIDFFTQPFENQQRSLRLLGTLTGREQRAEAFIEFRAERMRTIAERVANIPDGERPTVFLEAHAGMSDDCCNSPGRGNVGDYIEFVGGHNIGADVLAGSAGRLNLEYVISRDPEVYIATGGPHLEGTGGLVLGPGYDMGRAHTTLAAVASRQGIAELSAVKSGRVHGLSHLLINSPIDIVAIEAFAAWIHPDLFADLDPAETLAEINRRFLAVPYEGAHWVDLTKPANRP